MSKIHFSPGNEYRISPTGQSECLQIMTQMRRGPGSWVEKEQPQEKTSEGNQLQHRSLWDGAEELKGMAEAKPPV
jgi:hypothetical protein